MATESELRESLREGASPGGEIDLDAVLRRARARRRPRVAIATGAGVLGAAALVVPLAALGLGTGGLGVPLGAAEDSASEAVAPEGATLADGSGGAEEGRAPDEDVRLCGAPVAAEAPAPEDAADAELVLAIPALDLESGSGSVSVELLLVNAGERPVDAVVAAPPALLLAQEGVVVGTGSGPGAEPRAALLAPGESLAIPATLELVRCADPSASAPAEESPLPAGDYELTATVAVEAADGLVAVTGPAAPVRLG